MFGASAGELAKHNNQDQGRHPSATSIRFQTYISKQEECGNSSGTHPARRDLGDSRFTNIETRGITLSGFQTGEREICLTSMLVEKVRQSRQLGKLFSNLTLAARPTLQERC